MLQRPTPLGASGAAAQQRAAKATTTTTTTKIMLLRAAGTAPPFFCVSCFAWSPRRDRLRRATVAVPRASSRQFSRAASLLAYC